MFRKHFDRLSRRLLLVTAVLLVLTAAIYLLARYAPGIMFPWYQNFSASLLSVWSHITDLVPFSILECGILGAIWLVLGWSIRLIVVHKGPAHLLCTAANVCAGILFLFVVLWGADQFAPTFLSTTEYNESSFSIEEAAEAAEYYLDQANAYALKVPRDADGISDFGSFREIASGVEDGYRWLAANYGSRFAVGNVTPKPMAFSWLMDSIGLTGIYTAYTGEMSINVDTPDQSLPYVISHECAHRTTVTQENDANFAAFLACIHSGNTIYQYSGWYSAFIYVYNAIAKVDKDVQAELWNGMNDQLRADVLAANAHYKQFEKPVRKAAEKVNDTYLKAFNQSSGINNYGAVAGAMISWYWHDIAGTSGDSAEAAETAEAAG